MHTRNFRLYIYIGRREKQKVERVSERFPVYTVAETRGCDQVHVASTVRMLPGNRFPSYRKESAHTPEIRFGIRMDRGFGTYGKLSRFAVSLIDRCRYLAFVRTRVAGKVIRTSAIPTLLKTD